MKYYPGLALALALLPLAAAAQGPAPTTTTFRSESLNLRFTYPADLHETDPRSALAGTHLNVLGISTDADPALSKATVCLRPLLLAKSPESTSGSTSASETTPDGVTHTTITPTASATILLAELDIGCVIDHGNGDATDLLTRMAETVEKTPGMSPLIQPTWYNVGRQHVHIAAAQGHPQTGGVPSPFTLFTMGLSTTWNNHLLVWFFTSNNISLLDSITKSTVAFGRESPAPIYPSTVGNGNAAPPE